MNLRDLHYEWPGAAYLIFVAILIAFLMWMLYEYRRKVVLGFAEKPSLVKLLMPRSRFYYLLKSAALCAAWVCATLALMQPKGNGRYYVPEEQRQDDKVLQEALVEHEEDEEQQVVLRRKAHDVIFLVDASASMLINDTRTGVTRLDYAKDIIDEVVSQLDGQTVALYAFTSEATTVVPLTMDYLFFRLMLRNIGINEGDVAGTDLVEALETVKKKHFGGSGKLRTLILLTDGGDTRLEQLQGEQRASEMQTIISRIGDAEEQSLRIFTVGLGSQEGKIIPDITFEGQPVHSSLDEDLLIKLSDRGRGRYYFGNAFSAFGISADLIRQIRKDDPFVEEITAPKIRGRVERFTQQGYEPEILYDLFFQGPLGIAIILLTVALLLPDTRKKRKEIHNE